jgi:hypothetical protein
MILFVHATIQNVIIYKLLTKLTNGKMVFGSPVGSPAVEPTTFTARIILFV